MPFVETPLTESIRMAVRREWSLEAGGSAVRLHGGEESAAFRVGDVVIRVGPEWRSVEELEWCHTVASAAAASVPEAVAPIVGSSGRTVAVVDGRPVSVWPFVDGEWADDDDAGQCSQAAVLLARLHLALRDADCGPRPPKSSPSAQVSELRDRALDDWLERFFCHRQHQGLHGDFYAGNLLARDGRIVAVLDWDEALVGPVEQELAWAAWEWGGGLWADEFSEVLEFADAYRCAGGLAAALPEEDIFQLVRARLRAEVQYTVATEEAGLELTADDVQYRHRQIEVFHRLRP